MLDGLNHVACLAAEERIQNHARHGGIRSSMIHSSGENRKEIPRGRSGSLYLFATQPRTLWTRTTTKNNRSLGVPILIVVEEPNRCHWVLCRTHRHLRSKDPSSSSGRMSREHFGSGSKFKEHKEQITLIVDRGYLSFISRTKC